MPNEMILRPGESLMEFSRRFPDWKFDSGESWIAYQARIHQDSTTTFHQDGGGDDDEPVVLDANAEREAMIARRLAASGVTRPADPAEPNAEQARKDMVKRQKDGWKTKPKKKEAAPPVSASAEAEGDDDSEEGEEDAGAARQRMIDLKYGRTK